MTATQATPDGPATAPVQAPAHAAGPVAGADARAAGRIRARARRARPLATAWAVVRKDITTELRARYALAATGVFAVACLAVVSFAVGPSFGGKAELLAAFLWTVLLFSASAGLAQAFMREVERKTWFTLRLVAAPSAVLLGKWVVNFVLLLATEAVVVPLFLGLFGVEFQSLPGFLAVMLLATVGLSAAITWVAALLAQARTHGALVSALTFPLVVPVLMAAVAGTRRALIEPGVMPEEVKPLVAYAGVIVTIGFLLSEHVLED